MRTLLFFCLFFVNIGAIQALSIDDSSIEFDFKKANQQFDQINLKLSIQDLNIGSLEAAVETLSNLVSQADRCVDLAQKKRTDLTDLARLDRSPSTIEKQGVDSVYLNRQKKELADQQAQCHLFSIRAKEAIIAYKTASSQLVKKDALIRDQPLWASLRQLIQQPSDYAMWPFFQEWIAHVIPPFNFLATLMSASFLMAIALLYQLNKRASPRFFGRYSPFRVSSVLLLTTGLSFGGLCLWRLMSAPNTLTFIVPAIFSGYFLSLLLVNFLFKLNVIRGGFLKYSLDQAFFRHTLIVMLNLACIGLLGSVFSSGVATNNALWQLSQSLYLFTILGASFFFMVYFCHRHSHYIFVHAHRRFIRFIAFSWILICALLDSQGYHHLATHLTFSGLCAIAIVTMTGLLTLGIQQLYGALYTAPTARTWISMHLGYRREQFLTEFFILKLAAQILVIAFGVYLIGQSIDFATYTIESLFTELVDGFHMASIMIYPMRILFGAVMFCLLFLICRAISRSIIRYNQLDGEEETQVALASIASYAGFMFSLIIGLMIAGFNFTGLAIVAGALSVGIGLGLQSIVNNFVSGLILLIEKPIRPGDRINVDGVEGFVKKIRVRSTQMITPSREDIIIPNSDLITRRVTNYMFSDKNCRFSCDVGVAYGSDTECVRDTLLSLANLHEDVVKTGRFKPFVLFRAFGDSNLSFQLWCLIKDVNKKLIVQSDLNFAIEAAFRQQNISMAFPQRDIHINWPEPMSDKS